MSTTYAPNNRAPSAPVTSRYVGAAALVSAIRAAAALAPEYEPAALNPERYGPGRYPFTVPEEREAGAVFHMMPRGADWLETTADGPSCRFPRVDVHPETPGPFLPPRTDARASFHYSASGARGSLTVANLRPALLALADKVQAQRLAFDGKPKRARCPVAVAGSKGSAPHVAARAMWEARDYAGALALAGNVGALFFGVPAKDSAPFPYMSAQGTEAAGQSLTIARSIQTGRFRVLHTACGLAVDSPKHGAPAAGFASFSIALAWLESQAACADWCEKLQAAAAAARPFDQAGALAYYMADPEPAAEAAEPAQDAPEPAAPVVAPMEAAPAVLAPEFPHPAAVAQLRESAAVLARASLLFAPDAGRASTLAEARAGNLQAAPAVLAHLQRLAEHGRTADLRRDATEAARALADALPGNSQAGDSVPPSYAFPADASPATHSAPIEPEPRAARDGERFRLHEAGPGAYLWTSAEVFDAPHAYHVAQHVLSALCNVRTGGRRWATCAETGAFLFGCEKDGRPLKAAPVFVAPPVTPAAESAKWEAAAVRAESIGNTRRAEVCREIAAEAEPQQCTADYGNDPRMITRARAAYLLRAARSRGPGHAPRRTGLHAYAIGNSSLRISTGRTCPPPTQSEAKPLATHSEPAAAPIPWQVLAAQPRAIYATPVYTIGKHEWCTVVYAHPVYAVCTDHVWRRVSENRGRFWQAREWPTYDSDKTYSGLPQSLGKRVFAPNREAIEAALADAKAGTLPAWVSAATRETLTRGIDARAEWEAKYQQPMATHTPATQPAPAAEPAPVATHSQALAPAAPAADPVPPATHSGPFRISALNTTARENRGVHVLFAANRDRSGPCVGFYMSAQTYAAIPLGVEATPADYERFGVLEPAPANFSFGPSNQGTPGAESEPKPMPRASCPAMDGAVYRVHCRTYSKARTLLGAPAFIPRHGVACAADESEALASFRCLAPFRTEAANAHRARVAAALRLDRREARKPAPVPAKANPFKALAIFQTYVQEVGDTGRVPTAAMLEAEAERIEAAAAGMAGAPGVAANYAAAAVHFREAAQDKRGHEAAQAPTVPWPLPTGRAPTREDHARASSESGFGMAREPLAESIPGLDVAELGPEALAEFEPPAIDAQREALSERARASVAAPIPSLRIPAGDPRVRIPARFAPVYILQA